MGGEGTGDDSTSADGCGGDGTGATGGIGGGAGGGRSANDVIVVGMDTLCIVTPSISPATLGSLANVVSVLVVVGTSSGLMLVMVASTMTEPAVTTSVTAADATPSAEARRALKGARWKLATSATDEMTNVEVVR